MTQTTIAPTPVPGYCVDHVQLPLAVWIQNDDKKWLFGGVFDFMQWWVFAQISNKQWTCIDNSTRWQTEKKLVHIYDFWALTLDLEVKKLKIN